MRRFFPHALGFLFCLIFSVASCRNSGDVQAGEHLADSPLLADTSRRTLAVVAVGDLPAGSIGVGAAQAVEIFSQISGLSRLRELLGLLSVLQTNGALGTEYSSAALIFGVVDGARVVSLGFAGRGDLSVDIMSTINSTARSHGLEIEAVSQAESRVLRSLGSGDYVSISVSGRVLKFRHSSNGTWPDPDTVLFPEMFRTLRKTKGLVGISVFALGEFGRVLGAASPLPWNPPLGSSLAVITRLREDGRQDLTIKFAIPGLGEALKRCSGASNEGLGFSSGVSPEGSDGYEVRISPVISCALGAKTSGIVQLRWRVSPPSHFQLLTPFEERKVVLNLPDGWPAGHRPKAEYLASCGGVVVYSGEPPDCGSVRVGDDLVFIRAPFDFISRLLVGIPPDAGEFFRLMRLYQGEAVEVRGRVNEDELILSMG